MTAWNKIKIFTALCICFSIGLCACSDIEPGAAEVNETKSGIIAELDQFVMQPDNIDALLTFDGEIKTTASTYNITYGEDNQRKMYVFSNPVREYAKGSFAAINKEIFSMEEHTFGVSNSIYSAQFTAEKITVSNGSRNIAVFPQNHCESIEKETFQSLYKSDVEAVVYKGKDVELYCMPTAAGVAIEIHYLKKPAGALEWKVDIDDCTYTNDSAGYIKLMKGKNNAAVIYPGIAADNSNMIYYHDSASILRKNGELYLHIGTASWADQTVEYPVKSMVHFDFYTEKMFFDSSVYQSAPKQNSLLNNISIFDESGEDCSGYTYLKCNLESITPADKNLLGSIRYHFYVAALTNAMDLEAYLVPDTWCSFTVNWETKPAYTEKIGEVHVDAAGYYYLDMTEFAKNYIEHAGEYTAECSIVLKAKDNSTGIVIAASADNTIAPPFFEVDYALEN